MRTSVDSAEVIFYLQSGERFEMIQSIYFNRSNFIYVQISENTEELKLIYGILLKLIVKLTNSSYSSDVSTGTFLGISVSFALVHRTTVPMHVHLGGQ